VRAAVLALVEALVEALADALVEAEAEGDGVADLVGDGVAEEVGVLAVLVGVGVTDLLGVGEGLGETVVTGSHCCPEVAATRTASARAAGAVNDMADTPVTSTPPAIRLVATGRTRVKHMSMPARAARYGYGTTVQFLVLSATINALHIYKTPPRVPRATRVRLAAPGPASAGCLPGECERHR
jgi:hypothetical protein